MGLSCKVFFDVQESSSDVYFVSNFTGRWGIANGVRKKRNTGGILKAVSVRLGLCFLLVSGGFRRACFGILICYYEGEEGG